MASCSNLAAAPSGSSGFLSGWYLRASFLYTWLRAWGDRAPRQQEAQGSSSGAGPRGRIRTRAARRRWRKRQRPDVDVVMWWD